MKNQYTEVLANEANKNLIQMIPTRPIIEYLIKSLSDNSELRERIHNTQKDLLTCFKYTLNCVKAELNNKNGYLPDQVVYDFSLEYYLNANEKYLTIEEPKQYVYQRQEHKEESTKNNEQPSLF